MGFERCKAYREESVRIAPGGEPATVGPGFLRVEGELGASVLMARFERVASARIGAALVLLAGVALSDAGIVEGQPSWRVVAKGVEYAAVALGPPTPLGDGILHVVRIDPKMAALRAYMASEAGERARTAREWCEAKGLVATINLGMYQTDMKSNVGYARKGTHLNNRGFNAYRSYLGFDPRRSDLAPVVFLDGEDPDVRSVLSEYGTAIQNLRLIRAPGINVWEKQDKRWPEAAIAEDGEGRVLFLLTQTPFSMWEFNRQILAVALGIRRAMHVEGGPEASLSICSRSLELHLSGQYETGTDGALQRTIPNIVGVLAGQ
jgi:hypothetical protein